MKTRRFAEVDVFAARAGAGNALAVVLDGEGFSTAAMQRFAAWTNLSETTFVLPPRAADADFRLRIFTPRSELAFAGHPTVGTTHAVLEAGIVDATRDRLKLECEAGVLPVRIERSAGAQRIFVRAPRPRRLDTTIDADALTAALGGAPLASAAPAAVDVGPVWLVARLEGEDSVRSLRPDFDALAGIAAATSTIGIAVFGAASDAGDVAMAVRAFCPGESIPEDPVTGSANAAIGGYLHALGALADFGPRWRASQGREVGRDGVVAVEVDSATGDVTIGGESITCIAGTLDWDVE